MRGGGVAFTAFCSGGPGGASDSALGFVGVFLFVFFSIMRLSVTGSERWRFQRTVSCFSSLLF